MALQACRVWLHAGTFHYVYTVRKKLVVAGDFCNASGWRARVSAAEEWLEKQGKGEKDKDAVGLVEIFVHGLENVELPRATRMLERDEAPRDDGAGDGSQRGDDERREGDVRMLGKEPLQLGRPGRGADMHSLCRAVGRDPEIAG